MIVKDLDSLEVIKHELGMNISELAEFLNVSRPTIYKWDKEGIPESKKPMVRFKLSRHRPYGVPDLVSMVQENTAYYINKNGNTFEKVNDQLFITVSIKMSQNIKDIIESYKGQSLFYVFPELDRFMPEVTHKNIDSVVALINKNLRIIVKACGIEKHISTHAARHSFATNADKVVLDKRHISKALGHSTFKMTENYLSDLRDDEIDDSMSDVYK